MIDIVAELTFDVMIRCWFSVTNTMCVTVLARPDDEVDFLLCRVVAAHHLGAFRREPQLAGDEHQSVWAAQRPEVDGRQILPLDEVHDGDRIERSSAVVRDEREAAVRRSHDLMRVRPGRHAPEDLPGIGVDDRQRQVGLGEHQQVPTHLRGFWCRPEDRAETRGKESACADCHKASSKGCS